MKVFISYSHKQSDWVLGVLVPVLTAASLDVLIDRERAKTGQAVQHLMDGLQADAEKSLLVLSPDYLESDYCQYEMKQALNGKNTSDGVLPVVRHAVTVPEVLESLIWSDLIDDTREEPWTTLLRACEATLAPSAPGWIQACREVTRHLKRGQSINLVTTQKTGKSWRALVEHLQQDHLPGLGRLDLRQGGANTRPGFIRAFLRACNIMEPVPDKPGDLEVFNNAIQNKETPPVIAVTHFDKTAKKKDELDNDLFDAIRYLIEERKLILLIQSRDQSFAELIPDDHPLSFLDLRRVEL